MNPREHEQVAVGVSTVTIVINIALSLFKFAAGILARSGAMVSDAVHSASDVLATLIVILGVKLAGRAADDDHPYGHERLECVAALILGLILGATGVGIGITGIRKIVGGEDLVSPGALALAAAVVSIVVKEWMYWYTRSAAKKIHSDALMADAWHHRSDSISSIGALVGIAFAMGGFPIMDSVASVVICLFIVKAAVDIFRDAVNKMVDRSCDQETLEKMSQLILAQPGVEGLDLLQTRLFGAKIYVDAEIAVQADLPLRQAHAIAEAVHDAMEEAFPMVKHCMVHVNPANP